MRSGAAVVLRPTGANARHHRHRGSIEWACQFPDKAGARAMTEQDGACTSGCRESVSCRLFLCACCKCQVFICRRCDRGQVYCGRGCAFETRRCKQREARRRYQATDRGRQMHAERSRRFRDRVTDHGPARVATASRAPETANGAAKPIQPAVKIAAARAIACHRCGHHVSDFLRLSPIRRPRRHSIDDRSSRPARRRRL